MWKKVGMLTLAFGFVANANAASAAPDFESVATIIGIAGVEDGDGILFGEVEIRLQGIAAPEDNNFIIDPGGPEATDNLKQLAQGRNVRCELDGTVTPRSNRPAGICYVGNQDLGALQVRQGFARDCPRYSGRRYALEEAAAVASGINISEIYELPRYCEE